MFSAAGSAKTLSRSPGAAALDSVCAGWSQRAAGLACKPSPCHTISAVGHQTAVGALGSSEPEADRSLPIPAQKPHLISK